MSPHPVTGALGLALCLAVLGGAAGARAHEGHQAPAPRPAPGFEPPAAGSYELPPIHTLAEHTLRGADGGVQRLPGLAPGEVAFVSFVYLSCGQACPLATATLAELDARLAEDPQLAGRVELVTLSFDPARDTPEAMARLRSGLRPKGRWRFLTSDGADALEPVLRDFGQDAVLLRGPDGDWTGELRHVLKVFLVDGQSRVRNIYSTGFLDPRLLINDARTVLGEGVAAPDTAAEADLAGP